MISIIEKKYTNKEMNIELTSFLDNKQNVWFRGKDVATILGYSNTTTDAIKRHVSENHKTKYLSRQQCDSRGWSMTYFIDEAGFYELVFGSKLEAAKKFRDWVFTTVLPSIRKYGQYKLFDSPWNKMIMIGNETDLHYKVVHFIRRYYPDTILVAGLGENQDTDDKRLDSYKKEYTRVQPDLMMLDYDKDYKGLCIQITN